MILSSSTPTKSTWTKYFKWLFLDKNAEGIFWHGSELKFSQLNSG